MDWIIYKHTNKINGKVYIGQTKQDPARRWRDGKGYLRDGQDTHFSRAIRKFGWDNFWHQIIEENIKSVNDANERERFWIEFYDSIKNGYNSTTGGEGYEMSLETRQKMSATRKGMKLSPTHLMHIREANRITAQNPVRNKKISEKLKGRIFTQEHIQKISDFAKTRIGNKNPFYGKHHTEFQKEKYREMFGKAIICLETNAKFVSSGEASNILGINGGNIRSSCRLGIQAKVGKLWFHFYYEGQKKPIFKYNNIKSVYNIETNEIFENCIDAGKSVNKSSKLIGMCCRKKIQTAGGYHWAYYDDFKKYTNDEVKSILNTNVMHKGMKKKVLCVESNITYESTCDASRKTGICQTSIAKACSGKQETANGYHWKYIN